MQGERAGQVRRHGERELPAPQHACAPALPRHPPTCPPHSPTPRAPMSPRRSPVTPPGAVERRSAGSYRPAPTIAGRRRLDRQASHPFPCVTQAAGPVHPARQVRRSHTPCDSPEGVRRGGPPVVGRRRRARNLARDVQHPDLDRQPARLGPHRPDARARHRPPHSCRRGRRGHGRGAARGHRPRPRPLLRRPGAERGRHRAGHDRARRTTAIDADTGARGRRRRGQPGHPDARRRCRSAGGCRCCRAPARSRSAARSAPTSTARTTTHRAASATTSVDRPGDGGRRDPHADAGRPRRRAVLGHRRRHGPDRRDRSATRPAAPRPRPAYFIVDTDRTRNLDELHRPAHRRPDDDLRLLRRVVRHHHHRRALRPRPAHPGHHATRTELPAKLRAATR